MINCPECETNLDIDAESVDEGETVSCPECGNEYEIVNTNPVELKQIEDGYEEDEEEEEAESEDGDYS